MSLGVQLFYWILLLEWTAQVIIQVSFCYAIYLVRGETFFKITTVKDKKNKLVK